MSHIDTFNAAVKRIRIAARDCPAEAWDWIDIALMEIGRAYIGRVSELLAANTAEVDRRREAETKRDDRQKRVAEWCAAAFGVEHATSLPQRGVRLLEEAIEAYQATGADAGMAHKLIDFVFARPRGELSQEIGGIGVCLLALANAAGLSADAEEAREVDRVLAKPVQDFTARNEAKNAAGFNTAGAYPLASDA